MHLDDIVLLISIFFKQRAVEKDSTKYNRVSHLIETPRINQFIIESARSVQDLL